MNASDTRLFLVVGPAGMVGSQFVDQLTCARLATVRTSEKAMRSLL